MQPPASPLKTWLTSLTPLVIGLFISVAMWLILPKLIGPFYSRIVINIGIAMMLAVSLNIVNGMTGQFSMGHAGFMTVGGYTAGMITYYGSQLLWHDALKHGGTFGPGALLFAVACVAGGVAAAVAGYIVGLPSLRLRGDYLAIATLGFGEIVRVLLQQTNSKLASWDAIQKSTFSQWVPPPVGGSLGFTGLPKYTDLFWVYAFLTVIVVVAYRLKYSSLGREMLSIREDEIAAQAMGVNITRVKVSAFVIAGFLAGVAGGVNAHVFGQDIAPSDAGFQRSFDIIIMAVLGGQGSISGVMLAAALLTLLPEGLRSAGIEQYRLIIYALTLIGMMLFRPQGLCGMNELWDFLPGRRGEERRA